jgi:hypothetical protein
LSARHSPHIPQKTSSASSMSKSASQMADDVADLDGFADRIRALGHKARDPRFLESI